MNVAPSGNPVVVQKYGGTSVASTDRICAIADRLLRARETHKRLVVVVSAMGAATDELMDLLLATGEQVAVSLLGLALQGLGVPAISLTAMQCGIRTDGVFNIARIESIDISRIVEELDRGRVVIIAGFQGVTRDQEVTTLGRGGSDITGAALAAALSADVCEICTDVDGVLSADPNIVPGARCWPEISYMEAIEMATSGAKVLHPRAAEVCMTHKIPIHVRSSFHDREGTWIRGENDMVIEQASVVGVSSDRNIAKITLTDVPDRPGLAAEVFQDLAERDISVRLIIQSASAEGLGRITFVLDDEYVGRAIDLVEGWKAQQVSGDAVVERDVATISIVGSRLASTPGLAARMFAVLGREGINIDCISSSEMKVACVIADTHLERAVQSVHEEFFALEAMESADVATGS